MGVCRIRKLFNLEGLAPLHIAGWTGNLELFQYLFDNSSNQNPTNNIGDTPLHWAALSGHLKVCKFLFKKRVDVNSMNQKQRTPLHAATFTGDFF